MKQDFQAVLIRSSVVAFMAASLFIPASSQAQTHVPKTIFQFSGTPEGADPTGNITVLTDGSLLGATLVGGVTGNGVIYRLVPASSGWTEHLIYNFTGADGARPGTVPLAGRGGVLYGTTSSGGDFGYGVAYKLSPPTVAGGSWTETVLHSFGATPTDGQNPSSGLVGGKYGALYGATKAGGTSPVPHGEGTIYQLVPPTSSGAPWVCNVLYSFDDPVGTPGYSPKQVTIGPDGTVYGTATSMVFGLHPPTQAGGAWTFEVLHELGGTDGYDPRAGVIIDSSGSLYGTADAGGTGGPLANAGVVFKLTAPAAPGDPWTETVLYDFTGSVSDGWSPTTPVAFGPNGVLYGSSSNVIYKLTPPAAAGGAWTETGLYTIPPNNTLLNGNVTVGSQGELYGWYSLGGGDIGFDYILR